MNQNTDRYKHPFSYIFCADGCCITAYRGSDREVAIPESIEGIPVTAIGRNAFANMDFLEKVQIPNTLLHIEGGAFSGCTGLANEKGLVIIGKFLCEVTRKRMRKIFIPQGVEEIIPFAFSDCNSLQEVTLPEGLKTIRQNSFYRCKRLRCVTIPESTEQIEKDGFYQCHKLTKIVVSEQLLATMDKKEIGKQFLKAPLLEDWLFEETNPPSPLEKYLIPLLTAKKAREKYFPQLVSRGQAKKLEILLPACKNLELKELEHLISIPAIRQEGEIKGLLMQEMKRRYPAEEIEKIRNRKDEVELGIAERTLKEWREIFGISKKDGCATISSYKSREKDAVIPDSITGLPVTCIRQECFCKCTHLTSVTLPDTIREIRENAFHSCTALKKVVLPKGLTRLEDGVFADCHSLESIEIPETVLQIGCAAPSLVTDGVFQNCSSLISVNIPNGVEEIGCRAFRNCTSLRSLILPPSIHSIGVGAFRWASKLTLTVYRGSYAEIYAKEHRIPHTIL